MELMRHNCGILNYWYAAALSEQVTARTLGRIIMDEMIALWRMPDGLSRPSRTSAYTGMRH